MGKHTKLTEENIQDIIRLYSTKEIPSTHRLGEKFKVCHKQITKILKDNNVPINKKGMQLKYGRDEVLQRYADKNRKDGKKIVAICKLTGKEYNDYSNVSGALTDHIKSNYPNVEIPSTYKRRMQYKSTGKYWHEEYFDLIDKDIQPVKKCKYCDWETIDVDNRTGAYVNHLLKAHNKKIDDYIIEFPEEIIFHPTHQTKLKRDSTMETAEDYLICQICGEKFKAVNNVHLKKHNITPDEYKLKYGVESLMSNTLTAITAKRLKVYNEESLTFCPESKDELEIKTIIMGLGVEVISHDRKILNGKEIDLLIPSLGFGIEYNGNKFHTEDYGKKYPTYHLDKLVMSNSKGYGLIQIFEDEWVQHKELVTNKIKHILGFATGKKIGARCCVVREILTHEKNEFLSKYHIQGPDTSTVKLGAFYGNILVGVMTFRTITSVEFELTRFATNYDFIISGLASKMIKNFIKNYNPQKIISFADRRWTIKKDNNLYTALGFKLISTTRPEYRYYNTKISRYTRFHKFGFRKQNLSKKHGLSMDLTEREMTKQLGYDRIWDCGLFKYELTLTN